MTECPVCHGQMGPGRPLIAEIAVKTCRQCGFLISDIKTGGAADPEFSRINDEAYQRSIGKVRQAQAGEILRTVERFVAAKGDWLDVGCSFGYLLREAKHAGFRVFGVEPDEKACLSARELVGDDAVHWGLMTDETRPDASADVISTLDVLEHIPADGLSDFARLIHRKLKPGGVWVIKVPSTEGLYFTLSHRLLPLSRPFASGAVKRLWQSEYEFPHTVYFNETTLGQFLKQNGYEILTSTYLAEVPNATVLDRLLVDDTIPKWQAALSAPAFYLVNFVEQLRGKSDALLVLARRNSLPTPV